MLIALYARPTRRLIGRIIQYGSSFLTIVFGAIAFISTALLEWGHELDDADIPEEYKDPPP